MLPSLAILGLCAAFCPEPPAVGGLASAPRQAHAEDRQDAEVVRGLPGDVVTLGPEVVGALRASPRGVGPRKMLRVAEFPLGDGAKLPLVLEEKSVLAADFRIEVESAGADGSVERRALPAPAVRCYGGLVDGLPGSEAWFAVWNDPDPAAGAGIDRSFVHGFIRLPDGMRIVTTPPSRLADRGRLPTVVFDPARHPQAVAIDPESFCGAELLLGGGLQPRATGQAPRARSGAEELGTIGGRGHGDEGGVGAGGDGGIAGEATCRELSVAIDTDTAFTRDLFGGDSTAAAAYALALVSAVSEIAERDVATRYKLRYLRLRDPAASNIAALYASELMADWRANMRHVPRDFVHSLSGGGDQSGEAYLGALCSESTFGSDFAFGSSRGLVGSFPYPLPDFQDGTFDVFVVGHEIGHTLGAPHTFSSNPVFETCGTSESSCVAGATGSLMSYCVFCPGGTANVSLSYHPISAGYIAAKFAELPCDYTGGEAPVARDDIARSMAVDPVVVPVLLNDRGSGCSEVEIAWFAPKSARGCAVESIVGADGRGALRVAPLDGIAGSDSVDYGVVDGGGASAVATLHLEWMPPSPSTTVVGATPGIDVAAYDTAALGDIVALPDFGQLTPFLTSSVSRPHFTASGSQVVPPTDRPDRVALRYEGWLTVPWRDIWRFVLISDAGSRLWIDDVLVVDHDGVHGATRMDGYASLAVGRHRVRVEYFEDTGAARLNLRWSRPGVAESDIVTSWYTRGGVVPQPDIDRSGSVDGWDLTRLLGAWGACAGCVEDLDQNGLVESADLSLLIDAWGPVDRGG